MTGPSWSASSSPWNGPLYTYIACTHAALKATLLSAVSENNILPACRVHGYWDAGLCVQVAGYYGDDAVETRRLAT